METAESSSMRHALVPIKGGGAYAMELQADLLTLYGEDGHTVLLLPREEAARYLHFEWDLQRGRVLEFRLLGGLRSMRFVCPAAAAGALCAWLPMGTSWPPATHTLLVLAAGLTGLAWGPVRGIGVAVCVAGLLGLLPLRRNLAPLNAVVCGGGALLALFGPAFGYFTSMTSVTLLYGALLAVAAVEQLAHLGPNHFVYESRRAVAHPGMRRHSSVLIYRVAYAAGAAALAFAGLAAVLAYAPIAPAPAGQPFSDAAVFFLAALGVGAPVPLLLLRRRPPYGEALLTAQLLIAVLTVYAWGLGYLALGGSIPDFTGDAFAAAVSDPARPYFAVPLLLLEWAFRRWFVRIAEREAAEED